MRHGRQKKYGKFGLKANISRKLADAGINTPSQIRAMTDGELLAIEGIGPGTLKQIREVFPYDGG